MRELKGDWRDLLNGFMLALDLRKMFLALCGIFFTMVVIGVVTVVIGNQLDPDYVPAPDQFHFHHLWNSLTRSWHVIFSGTAAHAADWRIYIPYGLFSVLAFLVIWAYFGGAISRIAAYEIAKDGERIETAKALQFASKKFWSFFWAPLICVIGFAFFFLCNFLGGLIGKVLDVIPYLGYIGAPLVTLLLPLAILSGFIMTLIALGTVAGAPLFTPAVAAEGTDSFDAVSRGFSYVYSRPWHYIGYQYLSAVYGQVCVAFVVLFAVLMCSVGIRAGAYGFDLFGIWHKGQFHQVAYASWNIVLSKDLENAPYKWDAQTLAKETFFIERPHPYGRLQQASICLVHPKWSVEMKNVGRGSGLSPQERTELRDQWQKLQAGWEKEKDPKKRRDLQRPHLAKIHQLAVHASAMDPEFAGQLLLEVDNVHPAYMDVEKRLGQLGFTKHGTQWAAPRKYPEPADYTPPAVNPWGQRIAGYILTVWLVIVLGLALGYPVAYFFSQQTMIYFILRKKVDGIEMNEVFEETEEEEKLPEPIPPPKPAETPVAPPPVAEGKSPEPPKV